MKKLLLSLCVISGMSYAADLDMNNLYCNDYKLTSATTLSDVLTKCSVIKDHPDDNGYYLGTFEVKFTNTATNTTVKCNFTESAPSSLLNGCR